MKKYLPGILLLLVFIQSRSNAQGTWNTLTNTAPDYNGGVMILLTNGTVMCLTEDSSGYYDSYIGNTWDLLTPDSTGSYLNGTWTKLSPMHDTRLYCSTWVMPDGNLYVAGGEYGTGASTGEVYNTKTNTWTYINGVPGGYSFIDGSTENLYDGSILQGAFYSYNYSATLLFNENSNSYSIGGSCLGYHDEVSWVKLPDSSIMNIDCFSKNSERYIPKMHKWIADAKLYNYVMDFKLGETGPGFLLPNGKLFFLSDTTYSAIYTPSGDTSKGSWIQGPAMPVSGGVKLGCPDAPAAMMATGNILCAFGPERAFTTPVYFYEFNYLTNTFTQVGAPGGGSAYNSRVCASNMLDLPDGSVLTSFQGSSTYYQYVPSGSPLVSGQPTIDTIISNCPNFKITGKLFNGISEGAAYGDDWQMATNYPIVSLTAGNQVYYAKTSHWNRIGAVMTGNLEDTADFELPSMPDGTYSAQVIVNGNASNFYPITITCPTGIQEIETTHVNITLYPNPNNGQFTIDIQNASGENQLEVFNLLGQKVYNMTLDQVKGSNAIDIGSQPNGVYLYKVIAETGEVINQGKLVIQK